MLATTILFRLLNQLCLKLCNLISKRINLLLKLSNMIINAEDVSTRFGFNIFRPVSIFKSVVSVLITR